MADKITVTMHPPKNSGTIEVHPDMVEHHIRKGWKADPVELKPAKRKYIKPAIEGDAD